LVKENIRNKNTGAKSAGRKTAKFLKFVSGTDKDDLAPQFLVYCHSHGVPILGLLEGFLWVLLLRLLLGYLSFFRWDFIFQTREMRDD
jgi:hypothetical protein